MTIWNDETIESLKKLWMDGHSASTIAKMLGEGFTKNAVIGKIHRLKIPNEGNRPVRARPSSTPRARVARTPSVSRARRTAVKLTANSMDRLFESRLLTETVPDINFLLPETVNFGFSQAVQGLGKDTCKWPVGDPRDTDFRFCGGHADGHTGTYCHHHEALAYKGSSSKAAPVRRYA